MTTQKNNRLKDITGYKSGRLLVTGFYGYKYSGGRTRPYWNCLCDCGNSFIAEGGAIKEGKVRSCGCLQHETRVKNGKKNHIDLVGKTIFEWYIEKRVEDRISKSGIHATQYLCRCSCGTERVVLGASLLCGESHDCGHSRREKLSKLKLHDLTGCCFGELTVLYRVGKESPTKWRCRCSCGIEKDYFQGGLVAGDSISCGHISMSHGEYYIYQFLKENNIPFVFNRTIPDLISPKGSRLRVDFLFYREEKLICAIEYQGEQHYNAPKTTDPRWKDFGKKQREITDDIKRKFFKERNIPLYEIKYTKTRKTIIKQLMSILIIHDLIHDNTVPSSQETA